MDPSTLKRNIPIIHEDKSFADLLLQLPGEIRGFHKLPQYAILHVEKKVFVITESWRTAIDESIIASNSLPKDNLCVLLTTDFDVIITSVGPDNGNLVFDKYAANVHYSGLPEVVSVVFDIFNDRVIISGSSMIYVCTLGDNEFGKCLRHNCTIDISESIFAAAANANNETKAFIPENVNEVYEVALWRTRLGYWLFARCNSNMILIYDYSAIFQNNLSEHIRAIDINTEHLGWITCFSTTIESVIFATGDSMGNMSIWHISPETSQPVPKLIAEKFLESPIATITIEDKAYTNNICISDETGAITFVTYSQKTNTLTFLKRIVFSPTSIPHQISMSTTNSGLSQIIGVDRESAAIHTCFAHENLVTLFRAHPDSPPAKGPQNIISSACILPNMMILITCGHDHSLFCWDLISCRLIREIKMLDQLCTRIVAFDELITFGQAYDIKCYTGHYSGKIHEYTVKLTRTMDLESIEESSGHQMLESISVPVFDIIETQEQTINSPMALNSLSTVSASNNMFLLGQDADNDTVHTQDTAMSSFMKVSYADKLSSFHLCNLPVTDLILSKRGELLIASFARRTLRVLLTSTNQVIRQLDYENPICNLSRLHFTEVTRRTDDLFAVIIKNGYEVVIYDCNQGSVLTKFSLDTFGMEVVSASVWEVVSSKDDQSRSLVGLCVTNGFGIFLFSEVTGCIRVELPECPEELDSPLDNLTLGCEGFEVECSPMWVVWTMRRMLILRIELGIDGSKPRVMKIVDYFVPRKNVHIKAAKALYMDTKIRLHQVLVLLSDGSTSIFRL